MRISEDRYTRDLRRLDLARRMIRHELRTQWIRVCTGLSDNRVRNLFRSYDKTSGKVRRHRGPSPTQLSAFLASPPLRAEASAIAGLAHALAAIPAQLKVRGREDGPALEVGERLVDVFDLFYRIAPQSHLKMDQFFPVVSALAAAEDLMLGHCGGCHGTLLIDPLLNDGRLCLSCEEDSVRAVRRSPPNPPASTRARMTASPARAPGSTRATVRNEALGLRHQLPLFDAMQRLVTEPAERKPVEADREGA
jgi:hypothetical protein